jgi:hypothetical protein
MEPQNTDETKTVQVEETTTVKGVTTFAPGHPTPSWSLWIFRTQFVLNKMLMFYLSATDRVPTKDVKEYLLIITAIDLGTWLFANSIGVKKKDLNLPE